MAKTCTECLHYHACRGTYYSAKGDGTLLYDFEGEMYGDSGCEHYETKSKDAEAVHGEWVYAGGRPIHCNQCGYAPEHPLTTDNSSFCPHCGADMRKRDVNA